MVREIKFRGMTIEGICVEGNLTVITSKIGPAEPGCYISNSAGMPFAYMVRPETVGQYTGLLDKNGREIYEGDIVKRHLDYFTDPADFGGRRHIKRDDIFAIEWGTWCWIKRGQSQSSPTSFDPIYARECEVIGNIYQHPELINHQHTSI